MDNQNNQTNQKKSYQLYITVAVLILSIVSIILSSVCIGVVINKDKPVDDIFNSRKIEIIYEYVITSSMSTGDSVPIGSLLKKDENPSFENQTFNTGFTISVDGTVSDNDFEIKNPKMNDGFDVNKNYIFIGWYTSPTYEDETKWNFAEDRVYRLTRFYARWSEKA